MVFLVEWTLFTEPLGKLPADNLRPFYQLLTPETAAKLKQLAAMKAIPQVSPF
ncbi:hypothetical protein FQN57_000800, partial [Myotisia sp. PD_48]